MATTDGALAAVYVGIFESLFIDNCCGIAIPALLGFEYFVNLDREVNLFWKRKFTGASALFLWNRYLPLLTIILDMCQSVHMSDQSCTSFVWVTSIVSVLQYIPWAAFSTLRAFALSGRRFFLTALIFLLSIVPIIINYARYRWLTSANDPMFGCVNQLVLPGHLAQRLTIVSRVCLIAADLLVMLVTWRATRSAGGLSSDVEGWSFANTLLRNGIVYFFVLLLLNALHLTFSMLSLNETFVNVSYVTIFTEPLTAILVSRFLLDLQETSHAATDDADTMRLSTDFRVSGLNFAPILGSLGSTVGGGSMHSSIDQWGTHCDEEDGASAGIRMDVIEKPV